MAGTPPLPAAAAASPDSPQALARAAAAYTHPPLSPPHRNHSLPPHLSPPRIVRLLAPPHSAPSKGLLPSPPPFKAPPTPCVAQVSGEFSEAFTGFDYVAPICPPSPAQAPASPAQPRFWPSSPWNISPLPGPAGPGGFLPPDSPPAPLSEAGTEPSDLALPGPAQRQPSQQPPQPQPPQQQVRLATWRLVRRVVSHCIGPGRGVTGEEGRE